MTERLTDEAALAMARETAGKAYVGSIPDICDEDRDMWLYAYREGRWKNSPSVQSALAAIRAIEDRHAAEIAAKDATIKTLYDDRDGEREFIATLRAENARLRAAWADLANTINIQDSHFYKAMIAVERMMLDMKKRARAALTDTGAA